MQTEQEQQVERHLEDTASALRVAVELLEDFGAVTMMPGRLAVLLRARELVDDARASLNAALQVLDPSDDDPPDAGEPPDDDEDDHPPDRPVLTPERDVLTPLAGRWLLVTVGRLASGQSIVTFDPVPALISRQTVIGSAGPDPTRLDLHQFLAAGEDGHLSPVREGFGLGLSRRVFAAPWPEEEDPTRLQGRVAEMLAWVDAARASWEQRCADAARAQGAAQDAGEEGRDQE